MPVEIDFTHEGNLEEFVKDNIVLINSGFNVFKSDLKAHENAKHDETDVRNYLKNKLYSESSTMKTTLLAEFETVDFKKKSITDIANNHIYYKNDLEIFFEKELFNDLFENTPDDLDLKIASYIESLSTVNESKKKYVSSVLKNIVKKSTILLRQNGFSNNIVNVESGVQTANAGDSAQFLFVSRAILAGFNCSNVDVRSSRYDAVIDYKGLIFKVQIKGISGTTVSFKDRDRGGRGIDTHNERNIGKRITSKDCDIYVAVDKQVGICYIIPMRDFVDKLDESKIKTISVNELTQFRENWGVIQQVCDSDPRSKYTGEKIMEMLEEAFGEKKE